MNNKIRNTFSVIALFVASQTSAQALDYKLEQSANIAMPTEYAAAKETTSYIWPQVHQSNQKQMFDKQTRSSDEYWQVVTGAQLNKGLKLHTTSDALIRLAPYASYQSGSRQVAPAIEPNSLVLASTDKTIVNAQQVMSQAQMQSAGFSDGSVALKVSDNLRNLTLRTAQPLAKQGQYLLHVKEKNSPLKLTLSAKSNVTALADSTMALNMSLADSKIKNSEVKVRLLDPQGKQVSASYNNSQLSFTHDLNYFGSHQGLYELEVHVTKTLDGQQVSRTLKFPFANAVKTANIEQKPWLDTKSGYQVPVRVFESGRYNVTATLQGVNAQGQAVRLQTVSTAGWLDADGVLALPFTMDKFKQYKNFNLVDIELMDQSRMMVQQVQSSDSTI